MYTRWLQAGSFSGTMRSHERGMSAGGCADRGGPTPAAWGPNSGSCSIIEPWNVGPKFFEANRRALHARERLIPYIYTAHRALFDYGVGLLQPMYYQHPRLDGAYLMTPTDFAQYFFGPDVIVAPIVAPAGEPKGDPSQTLASKTTWIPPGKWYNGLTGELTTVTAAQGINHTRGYTLGEVPMWFKSGAVVPYLPLKSLPSLAGVATKQVLRPDVPALPHPRQPLPPAAPVASCCDRSLVRSSTRVRPRCGRFIPIAHAAHTTHVQTRYDLADWLCCVGI